MIQELQNLVNASAKTALLLAILLVSASRIGATPRGLEGEAAAVIARHFPEGRVALTLYSTRRNRYLARIRADEPFAPASNAKLITAFAAMKALSPDFRWETRFERGLLRDRKGVDRPDSLIVTGSGDPTLEYSDMERIAERLLQRGIRDVDGIFYDDSVFEEETKNPGLDEEGARPVSISPFIVNRNTVRFFIKIHPGWFREGRQPMVMPGDDGPEMAVRARFQSMQRGEGVIRVRQIPAELGVVFQLSGALPDRMQTYEVVTPVEFPEAYYFASLGRALRAAGIEGNFASERKTGGLHGTAPLYTHRSPPLRSILPAILKQSSNLHAESLLRAMALTSKMSGITSADGAAELKAVLKREFPSYGGSVELYDGSGLDRRDRITAEFITELLKRLFREDFGRDYLNALSLAGYDGTLKFREIPERLRGRIRAKSGTLESAQNMSGTMELDEDTVIFSFLVNGDHREIPERKREQDQALTEIYDLLEDQGVPSL